MEIELCEKDKLDVYRSMLKIIKNKSSVNHLSYCLSKYVGITIICTDLQYDGVSKVGVFVLRIFTSWYICFQILNSFAEPSDNCDTMFI